MTILSTGDRRFMLSKAMPRLGVPRVVVQVSDSPDRWPDIWTDGTTITVTREWARQTPGERGKRLVHELLHIRGLDHDEGIGYSTYPERDTYSMKVYKELKGGKLMRRNPTSRVLGLVLLALGGLWLLTQQAQQAQASGETNFTITIS